MTEPNPHPSASLTELLTETRILLPGTQVFLSILLTLPFTQRFERLTSTQHTVFMLTVFATVLALACFVMPAAYHRVAYPVHHRVSFKLFANWFLVVGLVPFSLALAATTYLVTSVASSEPMAIGATVAVGVVVAVVWWIVPLTRMHDWYGRRFPPRREHFEPTAEETR